MKWIYDVSKIVAAIGLIMILGVLALRYSEMKIIASVIVARDVQE